MILISMFKACDFSGSKADHVQCWKFILFASMIS
jgi:hypothetical protein